MVSNDIFRKLALSFPETEELPHFHLVSFRVRKKIFCTLNEKENRAMVKLSPEDQSVFILINPAIFYQVPGKWGQSGATYIELKKINLPMIKDAMRAAYCNIAPSALGDSFKR